MDITSFLQLSIEASIDELTGLLNRNAGKNHLSEVLSSLKEDGLCTVALCDLNGLKWVNDTYGHLEGDRFLKVTACTMQEGMEASDFAFRLSEMSSFWFSRIRILIRQPVFLRKSLRA